jgi:hypothetical protein
MSVALVTFSGAHPYRPQCVVDSSRALLETLLPDTAAELAVMNAERVTQAIDAGICPRCSDPLLPVPVPEGWRSAGSRATTCRCIPICETCSNWVEPFIGASAVTAWPTDEDDGGDHTRKEYETELAERFKASCTAAYLQSGASGPVLVSDDGVAEIQLRPNPGGWLEHGYDDTADQRERQS